MCEKLTCTNWAAAIHLTAKITNIPAAKQKCWKQIDASLYSVLWFSLAPNLQALFPGYTCVDV